MGNHLDRPEIREALKEGSGSIIRRSSTMQMETYYLAVLMPDGMILRLARQKNSPFQTFLRLLPVLGGCGSTYSFVRLSDCVQTGRRNSPPCQ